MQHLLTYHYECVALCKDISLQRGRCCARSLVSMYHANHSATESPCQISSLNVSLDPADTADRLWTIQTTPESTLFRATNSQRSESIFCTIQTNLPGTRKVKPIWILLKQETVSGSGISWAVCKSAPHSRQITTPAPTTQFFTGRMPFLPPNQQRQSTEGKSGHFA